MPDAERRLAAIMYTDIEGYSALTQTDESLAMKLLDKHRELMRSVFPKYSGREIKVTGDAFLFEFDSALQATECAVEMQRILREYSESAPHKLSVRIGIHVGDVIHRDGDVYGDAVNIASRIEPLATGGEICISEQVYDQVHNKVPYQLTKLQPRNLKNISFATDVYRLELWPAESEKPEEGYDRHRLAILPLVNMSPDPMDEYFADGMTEELISTTSSIGGLTLIARTSVMRYKGLTKGIDEIGRELSVGTVLEGSVRKAGNKMRISVQLIDVKSQGHLWAQSYDRDLDDVFAVQSDIAKQVADALKVRMLPNVTRQLEKRPTKSTEAYTLYLRGRYYWNERSKEGLLKAIEYFKRAIEVDSDYALAYSGMSDCYAVLGDHQLMPYSEAFAMQKENALKAVQLDDSLAEAYASLASALQDNDYDWEGAEREFKKALELNPNYATGHHWYAILLMRVRRFEESLHEALLAQTLDPISPMINVFCGEVYDAMRKYALSEKQFMKALALDPEFAPAHHEVLHTYLHGGKFDEAEKEVFELLRLTNNSPSARLHLAIVYGFAGKKDEAAEILGEMSKSPIDTYVPNLPIILAYLCLGDKEKAIELIQRDFESKANWLPDIATDPDYDSVRTDLRVVAILKRIGLGL